MFKFPICSCCCVWRRKGEACWVVFGKLGLGSSTASAHCFNNDRLLRVGGCVLVLLYASSWRVQSRLALLLVETR